MNKTWKYCKECDVETLHMCCHCENKTNTKTIISIPMPIIDMLVKNGVDIDEDTKSYEIEDAIDAAFNIARQEIIQEYLEWKRGK